jgi:hypothetical protein
MLTRRSLFKSLLSAAAVAPFIKVASIQAAKVAKKLDLASKTAKRLGYVLKAEDAKKGKHKAKYKAGANCQSCRFYKKPKEDWSKCSMAGNKLVTKAGWCKSHKPRKAKKA